MLAMSKNITEILGHLETEAQEVSSGSVKAIYQDMRLGSAFQPIFSLSHCRVVGYEGLLRATESVSGHAIPAGAVFAGAKSEAEIVQLDRMSRAVHMHNFTSQNDSLSWLFLNIDPNVIVQGKNYGSFFKDLLDYYKMPPSRVVVEIIEGAIDDESQLSESVEFYKNLGCLVAIDDFGAGHSNFERIWRLAPNIVKLDRSMIAQAVDNRTARRVLPGIVSLIHEVGSLVLIEGVETQEEAMIAVETDVDFVQGYYFGMPEPTLLSEHHSDKVDDLFRNYHDNMPQEVHYKRLSKHIAAFAEVVGKLQSGFAMEQACEPLLKVPGVDRCYLLNQYGIQIGTSVVVPSRRGFADIRYQPLADGAGANWIRRPYLRRALNNPKEVQLTRPYLSIANGELCVTISIAITVLSQIQVLCCDIDWS